jgi:hypothetical protein
MTKTDKLYDTLGELLYVVALADDVIQPKEISAFQQLFKNHPWKKDIEWSFSYEVARQSTVDEFYKKVIDTCKAHGPAPEYIEFIDAMKVISKAANGIEVSEQKIAHNFTQDLITKFKADLKNL